VLDLEKKQGNNQAIFIKNLFLRALQRLLFFSSASPAGTGGTSRFPPFAKKIEVTGR